jgi:solute:Na+ symporter, SSS family
MDSAYSSILGFLPEGLKGLSIAALTAAIVASLAGKLNSISTIYTYDIHNKYFRKKKKVVATEGDALHAAETETANNADENKQVWTGRIVAVAAILLSLLFTWDDLLGIGGEGGFTFIQKYTGFISPGVFAMFTLGMFWKRTTGSAAVAGLITGLVLAIFFNNYAVNLFGHETWLYTAFKTIEGGKEVYQIPFLINMGWSFFFTVVIMVAFSMAGPKINPKAFELDRSMFKLKPSIIAMIVITLLILTVLYAKFW